MWLALSLLGSFAAAAKPEKCSGNTQKVVAALSQDQVCKMKAVFHHENCLFTRVGWG